MNGSVNFEDVEFLAEDEMLKVTPKFREGRLQMITGNFGPFTPGVPLQVPVWMAINLGKYQNYGVFLIQQPVNCECVDVVNLNAMKFLRWKTPYFAGF